MTWVSAILKLGIVLGSLYDCLNSDEEFMSDVLARIDDDRWGGIYSEFVSGDRDLFVESMLLEAKQDPYGSEMLGVFADMVNVRCG